MKQPLRAILHKRERLTKPHSSKETWHIVLDILSPSFAYEVGDSLAIFPENDPRDIERLFHFFSLPKHASCVDTQTREEISLFSFLLKRVDLAKVPLGLISIVEEYIPSSKKEALRHFYTKEAFRGFLYISLPSFLRHFGSPHIPFDRILPELPPLLPRYYSIASSPKIHPMRVELTVSKVVHEMLGEKRYGVCSTFLTERTPFEGEYLECRLHEASHFRLPQNHDSPLIMVGPGTGIAPFRAFVQELECTRPVFPPSWLFFGDRNRQCDFLYEDFFIEREKRGNLLLDLAFSRDLEEKQYVQHKMWEKRVTLASWIAGKGAYVYVCGNAKKMAKDVEATLLNIFVDQKVVGSPEEAHHYLSDMRQSKRYCKDVY